MRFKVLVPIPDEEYMLKEVQVELTDEQILAIGDEYVKLKREREQHQVCENCVYYRAKNKHFGDCRNEDRWSTDEVHFTDTCCYFKENEE